MSASIDITPDLVSLGAIAAVRFAVTFARDARQRV
jgi:hypothetical protein